MISISLITALSVAILDVFIGHRVWRSNRQQPSNSLFFLLVIQICLWVVCNAFSQSGLPATETLFFVRLVMVVTAGIPVTLYFFSCVFPDKKLRLSKPWKTICICWAILNIIFNFLPFTFSGINLTANGFTLNSSWGIVVAALNFLIFGSLACFNFIKSARKAQGLEKVRLSYLTAAFVVMIVIVLFFNFFLVIIFHNSNLTNLGSWLMSVVITGMIGYSLLKIRFTGLDFILAKIFYYAVLIGWLLIALFFLLNLPQWEDRFAHPLAFIFLASWSISLIYIYQNLQDFLVKKIVNHGVDWKAENKIFSTHIAQDLDLGKITNETLRFYSRVIKNTGSLIYEDFTDDGKFYLTSTFAEEKDPSRLFELCEKEWQKQEIPRPIIFEELILENLPEQRMLINLMKKEGYGAVFPIVLYSGSKGILAMGKKLNQNAYFIQDIDLIEQTLQEVAVAADRATVYQNTKNFNGHLQRKINLATRKLVKANEKLMIADKMKDEFVSVASHELRTPMTAIKNYLWLVNKNNEEKNFKQNKKFIQIALDSTERLINMVNDMLTISRIEGNRFELNKRNLDLNVVMNQVFLDLQPLANDKDFKFSKESSTEALSIYGDADKIHEVMQNLVGNAIKFTTKGKVEMRCEKKGRCAIFSVSDTGPGIDKRDFPKLFNKFCRLENSYVKIKETGTGLGLYICKQIMLKHDGDITFKSELGKGSTFTLIFPLSKNKK
ncbi:MAG: ATP-binding protein [bacterium]|nr:ATP-binding protein [bacterium]